MIKSNVEKLNELKKEYKKFNTQTRSYNRLAIKIANQIKELEEKVNKDKEKKTKAQNETVDGGFMSKMINEVVNISNKD